MFKKDDIQFAPSEVVYTHDLVDVMESLCGDGLLSQGGTQLVDRMLEGVDLTGKKVLDLGSGLGGIDFYLAQKYAVEIVGVDVEPFIVQKAEKRLAAIKKTLKGTVRFAPEGPSDYLKQFEDESFDVVFSKESILHIPQKDKRYYYQQVNRVLKKGGTLAIMDWMHSSPDYSAELRHMFAMDTIPYNLITRQEYLSILDAAQFKNVQFADTSDKTTYHCGEHYKKIVEAKEMFEQQFDPQEYEDAVVSWKAEWNGFRNKELLTGIFRAEK